jgi:colanic acid/amylovoran biosynthesis protein
LGDDLSPQALKALYAELEVMIGTRMHANILSIISGTPVVAVAYEHKTAGIMNMLGLASFVVPIDQASERLQAVTQRL